MDLNKTLRDWGNKLKKEGFNMFPFTDGDNIVTLEINTKKFKANLWREKGKLFLFVPFPNSVEKEIKACLEYDFLKIAKNETKKLCSISEKLVGLNGKIEPWPLYSKYDSLGMKANVNSLEDVIFLLKAFGDVYEKTNSNI